MKHPKTDRNPLQRNLTRALKVLRQASDYSKRRHFHYLELSLLIFSAIFFVNTSNNKVGSSLLFGALGAGYLRKEANSLFLQEKIKKLETISQRILDNNKSGQITNIKEDLSDFKTATERDFQNKLTHINNKLHQQAEQYRSLKGDVKRIEDDYLPSDSLSSAKQEVDYDELRRIAEQARSQGKQAIQDFREGPFVTVQTYLTELQEKYEDIDNSLAKLKNREELFENLISGIHRIHQGIKPYTYEIVKGTQESHQCFLDAITSCKNRLIIVMPWPRLTIFTEEIKEIIDQKIIDKVEIQIGWGWWQDLNTYNKSKRTLIREPKEDINAQRFISKYPGKYSAVEWLKEKEGVENSTLKLKLLGTHEKYIIKDNDFLMIGSHNFKLPPEEWDVDLELGLKTNDKQLVDEAAQLFYGAHDFDDSSTNLP